MSDEQQMLNAELRAAFYSADRDERPFPFAREIHEAYHARQVLDDTVADKAAAGQLPEENGDCVVEPVMNTHFREILDIAYRHALMKDLIEEVFDRRFSMGDRVLYYHRGFRIANIESFNRSMDGPRIICIERGWLADIEPHDVLCKLEVAEVDITGRMLDAGGFEMKGVIRETWPDGGRYMTMKPCRPLMPIYRQLLGMREYR